MSAAQSLPSEFDRGIVTTVHQGDCAVSGDAGLTYSTVLGSCISACIYDPVARVGGMNHFLLGMQSGTAKDRYGASARYGAFAMEQLINLVLSRGSGRKSNLSIKVFGGGKISAALDDVGAKNVEFVREFLAAEGYAIASSDLGGNFARRVLFKPVSGKAFVKRLDSSAEAGVAREEIAIVRRGPVVAPVDNDIELF
ncbi:putative chemoreceptor glutamine deamidase CheD [Devosia pacifica]|uniref:Probable chemoreceptor glutamine deamidase CheD n=1 Tax=Devosia pacifica TaxID=1335967 RepID=A0A918S6U4_9HYPH|nr:chemotaxis protein CheD [Devosia pacifica]GHA25710.1 putative chemoreceptor glutamine deamidase CheD [Devosia pacifica]